MPLKQSTILFGIRTEDEVSIISITEAFFKNQRLRSMVKGGENVYNGINALVTYCYALVKNHGGLFCSEDLKTYMLYYRKGTFRKGLLDWVNYICLAVKVIGIKNLPAIFLREKKVKSIRDIEASKHGEEDYLYIWFLAQQGKEDLKDLLSARRHILNKAKEEGLSIYLECTCLRLKRIYSRFGFEFYNEHIEKDKGIQIWFGRYAHNTINK